MSCVVRAIRKKRPFKLAFKNQIILVPAMRHSPGVALFRLLHNWPEIEHVSVVEELKTLPHTTITKHI
jgi:hypothetical protein